MTARSCSARAGVKRIHMRMPDSRTKASTCFAPAVLRRISGVEKFIPRSSTACFRRRRASVNLVLLRSEIQSGMCAKLRTVAASTNRDHPTRSLSSSQFASTIKCSPGSHALLEVTHQDHSIGITLSLLVRATYIYFCSSRTSRSW